MPRINIEEGTNGYSRITVDLETYQPVRGYSTDFQYWADDYEYSPNSLEVFQMLAERLRNSSRRSSNIVLGQALTQEHFQQMIDELRDMDTARSAVGVPYHINKTPEGWPWVLNRTGRNPRESRKEFTGDIEFDVYAE